MIHVFFSKFLPQFEWFANIAFVGPAQMQMTGRFPHARGIHKLQYKHTLYTNICRLWWTFKGRAIWTAGHNFGNSFFAGGCLGWSRAERPSVSWTKVLETLCLQQPKEMLNIKFSQKHAKGHGYQQSPNTGQRMQSLTRAQRRGLRWNPKESTYARVGRCNQRKRALVKPEGSTYAGARSAR